MKTLETQYSKNNTSFKEKKLSKSSQKLLVQDETIKKLTETRDKYKTLNKSALGDMQEWYDRSVRLSSPPRKAKSSKNLAEMMNRTYSANSVRYSSPGLKSRKTTA